MGLSLSAYLDELHQRSDLIWPEPPAVVPLKVTPALAPLPGIRAVIWSVYGTLLHLEKGHLLHQHPQEIRMQIALEKTIQEFNMWYSMTRRQGQPWEGMLLQYNKFREDLEMVGTKRKGDYPEVDSAKLWSRIIERLQQKEYSWDQGQLGDADHLAAKVAYFFHASLQGVQANPGARDTLEHLTMSGIRQGLLADGQIFTLPQLLYHLKSQGSFAGTGSLLSPDLVIFSYQQKLRKPSLSLYEAAKHALRHVGIEPEQVLYVTHRLKDDLAAAKRIGFRTALFAADKNSCIVSAADVRDPEYKPDRLLSEISQVRSILGV